jgi:hypothetical protein
MSSIVPQNALDTPPPTPPPLRQGTAHLTRDQRRDIRLMHDLHHSDAEIIQRFTITQRQLDYTIQAARPTPRKPPGRHCKLKEPQMRGMRYRQKSYKTSLLQCTPEWRP